MKSKPSNIVLVPSYTMPEDRGSDTPRGLIVASNDSRFSAANPVTELNNFATGVADRENLEAELNLVAPSVPCARRFSYRTADTAADFLTEGDDVRAIGSSFKRVQSTGGEAEGKTLNKGLTVCLDKDEMVAGDEERWIARLTRRLYRNDLVRSYALLLAAATMGTKVWNGAASPDTDLAEQLALGGDSRGFDGNTVVLGGSAWLYRFIAYSAAGRTNGGPNALMTPQQLATLLQVDNVVVSKARKQSGANTKSRILGSYALTYHAEASPTKDDASNIKRFVTIGAGGRLGVYREEKAKTIELSVEHYSQIIITSTLGIRAITITQAAQQG